MNPKAFTAELIIVEVCSSKESFESKITPISLIADCLGKAWEKIAIVSTAKTEIQQFKDRDEKSGGLCVYVYNDTGGSLLKGGGLVTGRNVEALETLAEQTLSSVVNCPEDKELKFDAQKTEAVLLVRERKVKQIDVKVRNVSIQSKESLRYLAVHMDRNLRWEPHITETVKKANKTLGLLCCLTPRIRGPSECSRRLLGVTVQSRQPYGTSIWNCAMRKKTRVSNENLRSRSQEALERHHMRLSLC
ncbi:hypothetical protein Trydic_g19075 [Trypoxylus dichotomus]